MADETKDILINIKIDDTAAKKAFSSLKKTTSQTVSDMGGSFQTLGTSVGNKFKQMGKDVLDFEVSLKDIGAAFVGLGATAAGAFIAFDKASGRGGMLQQVTADFADLTEVIETTSESALSSLRETTKFTVADFDLMRISNKLLTMGLAENEEEMNNIVEIARRLGDQTQDTTSRVEDFSLLLANQSIMRLDNFGISSGNVRDRIEELQDAMPGLSRETAFMQATMEEAQKSMAVLGEEELTAATKMAQFKTQITNTKDELITALMPAMTEVAGWASEKFAEVKDVVETNLSAEGGASQFWSDFIRHIEQDVDESSPFSEKVTKWWIDFANDVKDSTEKAEGFWDGMLEYMNIKNTEYWKEQKQQTQEGLDDMREQYSMFTEDGRKAIDDLDTRTRLKVVKLKSDMETEIQSMSGGIYTESVTKAGGEYTEQEWADLNEAAFGKKQSGGTIGRAGFYDVGEAGKERVYLPQGSKVVPNDRITNNNNNSNVTINVNESIGDPSALASIVNFYLAR